MPFAPSSRHVDTVIFLFINYNWRLPRACLQISFRPGSGQKKIIMDYDNPGLERNLNSAMKFKVAEHSLSVIECMSFGNS